MTSELEESMKFTDEDFMRLAIQEALRCKDHKKFGAVLVDAGEVVARDHSSIYGDEDFTAHAELKVIRRGSQLYELDTRLLRDCVLYTTCEPCVMCAGAIGWARIGRVVAGMRRSDSPRNFFDSDPWHRSFEELARDMKILDYRVGVLAEECVKLLMP